MVLINFPGRLDYVRERVVLASILPSSWPLVLRCIEEFFPQASARVERMPVHQSAKAAPMLLAGRRRVESCSSTQDARVPLEDGDRLVAGAVVRLDSTGPLRPLSAADGAGLVMAVEADEAVLLAVHFPERLGQQYYAAIATLLRRLSDDLILSYRVTRTLAQGGRVDRVVLEAGWDRLMAGVVLLSSRLRVRAANIATDDLLADRRFFLPPVAGVLRPAVRSDADRLLDAAERVLRSGSEGESLSFAALRGPRRLLVRLHRLDQTSPFGGLAAAVRREDHRLIAIIEPEQSGGTAQTSPLASPLASLTSGTEASDPLQTSLCRA